MRVVLPLILPQVAVITVVPSAKLADQPPLRIILATVVLLLLLVTNPLWLTKLPL